MRLSVPLPPHTPRALSLSLYSPPRLLRVSLCLSLCVSLLANRASKTRYLQQARNAKAMADALGYSGAPAEPVSPKQAAMDAAMAYKAAQHDAETPAESKPRKRKVQCDIVNAEPEMAEELTTIVNWAYRVLTIQYSLYSLYSQYSLCSQSLIRVCVCV